MNTMLSYICRNRTTGEHFVRVGTEALPGRTEILAVVDGEVVNPSSPLVDINAITDEVVNAAKAAARMGTSRQGETPEQQLQRVRVYFEVLGESWGWNYTSMLSRITETLVRLLNEDNSIDVLEYQELIRELERVGHMAPTLIEPAINAYRRRYYS